jgi:quinol-cytochrome oxidoreductase complex cytochrome b subunit
MSDLKTTIDEDSIPFYPDHVRSEVKVIGGITAIVLIVGILGILLPVGIGEPADPMNTPLHVKPEWYFLALYQLLKFIPKTIGAVIPVILLIVLTFWPFIDRKPETSRKVQRLRFIIVAVSLVVLAAMTIWESVS